MSGEPRIIRQKMTPQEVSQLAADTFGDMIKVVADIETGTLAAGGMLHADAEVLLIEEGSEQPNVWGANYFPNRPPGARIEHTALINIRPSEGNPDQHILSESIREKVKNIAERWMGPT